MRGNSTADTMAARRRRDQSGAGSCARAGALLVMVTMAATSCSHVGEFVWVDAYAPPPPAVKAGYIIQAGDTLSVRVWNQEGMSGKARVRGDGMISLPFVNDVEAAGVEPTVLARRVQTKLKEFIVNPVVTVSLEEQAPFEISIVGEVARPGVYKLEQDVGMLKALATAGGLSPNASDDRIFVLRQRDQGSAPKFRLRPGDAIVVE